MNEAEVKKESKKKLKKTGWVWIDTSQHTRAFKQMQNAPDWIGFRNGVTVLIEFKGEGGEPTEGQWTFREKIGPHLGPNLAHMFIYHPDQLPEWMLQ